MDWRFDISLIDYAVKYLATLSLNVHGLSWETWTFHELEVTTGIGPV